MTDPTPPEGQKDRWFVLKHLVTTNRILVMIAIIGLLFTSIIVIVAGFAELFRIVSYLLEEGILHEELGSFLSVTVTEMIDLYLLGLFLLIIGLGLYQLYIDPDIDVPEWLDTPSFDVLKGRLLLVVIVVLAVMFLGYVAEATNGTFIAGLGIGIALVILACGYILSIHSSANIERKRLELQGTEKKS